MRLIAEGSGEDDDVDMALRKYASEIYFELLSRTNLPDVLMQVLPNPHRLVPLRPARPHPAPPKPPQAHLPPPKPTQAHLPPPKPTHPHPR